MGNEEEMREDPKVSICIPTYNQVDCLRRALDSILSQDFSDYEVIITDDSTNDGVSRLLREYSSSDRLRYFENADRKGSPENWNEAVRHASGEYIKILHHDDWFTQRGSLRKYVELLEDSPDADFAFSGTRIVDSRDAGERLHIPTPKQLEELRGEPTLLFLGNFVGSPSATIYRRSSAQPYDGNLKWLVDVDYYVRTLHANGNFAFTNEPLIATLDRAPHQVTFECRADPRVNVIEHLYLYEKIRKGIPASRSRAYLSHLNELLARFEADSVESIREMGYAGPVSPELVSGMYRRRISSVLFARPLSFVKRRIEKIKARNATS
jgi:glycosyltransferase involved in cell wall biosynthesis